MASSLSRVEDHVGDHDVDLPAVDDIQQWKEPAGFTSGLHMVTGISAAVLAGIAVLIAAKLRHLPPTGAEASAEELADEPVEEEIARPDAA